MSHPSVRGADGIAASRRILATAESTSLGVSQSTTDPGKRRSGRTGDLVKSWHPSFWISLAAGERDAGSRRLRAVVFPSCGTHKFSWSPRGSPIFGSSGATSRLTIGMNGGFTGLGGCMFHARSQRV